jgi:hypothetical protein
MNLFVLSLCVHAVTAVLGLGQVVGTAVLATAMRRENALAPAMQTALRRLVKGTTLALVLMLLSGALVEYASGGSFHDAWWFRIAFFQTLALGALNGLTRRALRRLDPAAPGEPLRRVARSAWVMCALIAEITILMEVKPW